MPAKISRGGGRTRGGATSRAREPRETAVPHGTETAINVVAPKQEDDEDDDVKTPITSETTPAPVESIPSGTAAGASASPQDAANPPARTPVQRLGSLNSSRSGSPAVRGRGSTLRGKSGTIKPTFKGRRSKEERTALEKDIIERERERNAERKAAEDDKKKERERKTKRETARANRGRGGYSGDLSGPFSMGSSRDERKVSQRTPLTFGSGSGSRATHVKNERGEDGAGPSSRSTGGSGGGEDGGRSGGGSGGGGRSSVKREDGGFVSSEDEEDEELPRKDINQIHIIEISSDENNAAPTQRPQRRTLPVRIGRKEHHERTFGINTEASAEAVAKALEQAEPVDEKPAIGALRQPTGKNKGKSKDIGTISTKKPFKGVWQDADELAPPAKTAQNDEDEIMGNAEQTGIIDAPPQPTASRNPSADAERRAKNRTKGIAEPVLQTEEDRAEWARIQTNLKHIRAELGPESIPVVDRAGDVTMENTPATVKKGTVRDNNVYLFQIPPLMPELSPPHIKQEPSSAAIPPVPADQPAEPVIKLESEFSLPTIPPTTPAFPSGAVGKLTVRESGRTTLDWGGTSYELHPGHKVSFLQEVVSVHVVDEKQRVVPEDAGVAVSFGRVKGKFLVVPDWGALS